MKEIFGLPAHVFFVHAPVVLIPLVCATVVAMGIWPPIRRKAGPFITVATGLVLLLTIMAVRSGQALDNALPGEFPVKRHERLGMATLYFVIALTVFVVTFLFVGRASDRSAAAKTTPLLRGLGAVCTVLAVLSTVLLIRTGHEGARAAWGSTFPKRPAAVTTTTAP